MNTPAFLHESASELVEATRSFYSAAQQPGSYAAAPDSLASLEEALQVLSAAWYQLAGQASPGIAERRRGRDSEAPSWPSVDGLSREQEVRLMATLHDVAAGFDHCARACREGRATITPLITARVTAERTDNQWGRARELSWFESRERPTRSVAGMRPREEALQR